ncbi:MAG: putative nucleoside-diphosphate-sugar epimerase [Candidatus Saganbacteria bacterium]|uniref:Putative nucleoside-diphosphate-sugar epimerase n=1 Tax=Candidatus Saganbacteria bacterium TaxID=2575572 RepID=A0A833L2G2_UNCSA|nr:MAG: putative nucleoside-diphosphate-sugar epimerase [Candidatus Saganbacteria bacterium]
MKKKKILICGATGFIGNNIAEYFVAKPDVELFGTYFRAKPLSNPRIKMLKADLTNQDDVNRIVVGMDIIIQAAAVTSGAKDIVNRPYYHVTDNAIINSLIFRAAFEHKVSHVVFFSCTVIYQSSDIPVKEIDLDLNEEIYENYFGIGWTKIYIEKMCEFYSRLGGTKYTVLRHSNIYGPHDKYDLEKSHVFGATMTKVLTNKDGKIVVWGAGDEARDLLYVKDLVDCVGLVMEKQAADFELVNVGSGTIISVRELVQKIINYSGKNINVVYDKNKPNIKTKLCLDINKAKELFGWSPNVSLDEGIKMTMEWYKTNIKDEVLV